MQKNLSGEEGGKTAFEKQHARGASQMGFSPTSPNLAREPGSNVGRATDREEEDSKSAQSKTFPVET